MIGVVFIIVTLPTVVAMTFIPDKHIDRVALIAAFLALSVTAYGVWVTIPGHLVDIKSKLDD